MKVFLVVAAALVSVLLLLAGLLWIIAVKNPFTGVAPDIITPLVVAPLVGTISTGWGALAVQLSVERRWRWLSWRRLLVFGFVAFLGGGAPFACRVLRAGELHFEDGWGDRVAVARVVAFYGSVGGTIFVGLGAVPLAAFGLIRRRRR